MRLASSRSGPAFLAPAVLVSGLAACAGDNDSLAYGAYINRWVGKPAAQLTADWGRPSYETSERGMRELQYIFAEAVSWGQRPIYITCTTKFLIDDAGTVKVAEAQGNACSTRNSGPEAGRR